MDISNLIYSECQSPVKVKMYNGITNCYEFRDVPCGKCYHCKMTRINEWVTRMVIQSNYSKYVYFGTLTYNGINPTILNDECLSVMSNFNQTGKFNDTPLVLRKDHVQKFLKRLRKNTGVKIQYAYCGEYGSTYSRPHYHYIMWTNQPISTLQVYKAWTAPSKKDPSKKVVIGKVEHRDIKNNPTPDPYDTDNSKVYRYVCKYIQKFDFNFEELKNIKQHKINFQKSFYHVKDSKSNFVYLNDERLDDYLKDKGIEDWYDYKKVFSPFFCCSKQPAIGYQYFAENVERFQRADYRLFGLPGDYLFPLYFIRKSKESLCPLKAQSETNSGTTSYSRLPKMAALLENITIAQRIAEDTDQIVQLFEDRDNVYTLYWYDRIQDLEQCKQLYAREDEQPRRDYVHRFRREYLGFTNHETRVEYSFRGTYFAMYSTTTGDYIGQETLENVKHIINYYYERLKKYILIPLSIQSEVSANKKAALIEEFGGIEQFKAAKELCLENHNNKIAACQNIYKQTKTFD